MVAQLETICTIFKKTRPSGTASFNCKFLGTEILQDDFAAQEFQTARNSKQRSARHTAPHAAVRCVE